MSHVFFFFFFSSRRRHTRSLCDWSSDVCSSDLARHDEVDIFGQRDQLADGGKELIERLSRESRIPMIKHLDGVCHVRSEERRVGKECRSRGSADDEEKKTERG